MFSFFPSRHQLLFHPGGLKRSSLGITMATKRTSKYKDIIKNSVLVRSDPPFVYQLRPEKGEIGNIPRLTLGERELDKLNKNILLVGETGAGKSALINTLVNYAMGVKWEDNVWFKMVEEKKKSQSESQTSDVMVYQVFGFEGQTLPFSLTIVDTPGYGDTEGIERDEIIGQRLFDLFCSDDGVHEINAVGLVMKSSENRLSDRLSYIFDSLVSLFGKNLEKNIVALITHSNGLTPENVLTALEAANIQCARDEDGEPVHFMFDNCQEKEKTRKNITALKRAWDTTTEGLDQFMGFINDNPSQELKTMIEVLRTRIRLTACIQNLQERMKMTELKKTEIQQTEEALKKYEQEMKNNQNFTVEVDVPYKETEEIDWFWPFDRATRCNVCEENCHYPGCTMAWDHSWCVVMKDGRCTSCTRKCPVSDHVRDNMIYVAKTKKEKVTMEEMKKYEENKKGTRNQSNLLETLREKMKDLQREEEQMLEESFQHVVTLEQIALNVNSVSTHVHLDLLIDKMKQKGDQGKVQRLELMKSQMEEDRRTKGAMQYVSGKLTGWMKKK